MTMTAQLGRGGSRTRHRMFLARGAVIGACARLIKWRNIFSPHVGHLMCPMIMIRAQRVTVTGTFFGKKIDETIVAGGCQLSRYYELRQVFN